MAKKSQSSSKAKRKTSAKEPIGNRSLGSKMAGGSMGGASGTMRARDEGSPRVAKRGKSGPKSKLAPSGRPSGRRS